PQRAPLGIDEARVAQLLEVVAQRRLGDVEQRDELADAYLARVLAQHVDELKPNRIAEGLGDRGHPDGVGLREVGVDDRLAAALAGRALVLWRELKVESHRSTSID